MSVEEYGLLSLVLLLPLVFNIIYTFSLDASIMRYYYEWRKNNLEKEAIFTIWISVLFWSIFVYIIILIFGKIFFNLILQSVPFSPYILIILFTSLVAITNVFAGKILRIQENSKGFIALSYFGSIFKIVLIILFVNYYEASAFSILLAGLISEILLFIPSFFVLSKSMNFRYNKLILKSSLIFQLPGLLGALLLNFSFLIDRFLIDRNFSILDVGYYSVAVKIGSIILAFMSIFQLALTPYIIKQSSELNSRISIGKVRNVYFDVMYLLTMALVLFSSELVDLFMGDYNYSVNIILLWILLAYYFQSLSFIPNLQFFISNRLSYTTFSTLLFLFLFLIFGFLLKTNFGLNGIAVSFFLSNSLVFFFNYFLANKFYRLRYNSNLFSNSILLVTISIFSVYFLESSFIVLFIKSLILVFIGYIKINKQVTLLNI